MFTPFLNFNNYKIFPAIRSISTVLQAHWASQSHISRFFFSPNCLGLRGFVNPCVLRISPSFYKVLSNLLPENFSPFFGRLLAAMVESNRVRWNSAKQQLFDPPPSPAHPRGPSYVLCPFPTADLCVNGTRSLPTSRCPKLVQKRPLALPPAPCRRQNLTASGAIQRFTGRDVTEGTTRSRPRRRGRRKWAKRPGRRTGARRGRCWPGLSTRACAGPRPGTRAGRPRTGQ